jgi:hypothetical protein
VIVVGLRRAPVFFQNALRLKAIYHRRAHVGGG